MKIVARSALVLALFPFASGAQSPGADTLRGGVPVTENGSPPRMAIDENKDLRRTRAYPMQPPTIPHKIDDYQLDLRANKCMSCHARTRTEVTQAPMISVTHYMDQDGNFLAELSPRRYFCTQCHVPQTDVKPLVENTFEDMSSVIAREQRLQKQDVPRRQPQPPQPQQR